MAALRTATAADLSRRLRRCRGYQRGADTIYAGLRRDHLAPTTGPIVVRGAKPRRCRRDRLLSDERVRRHSTKARRSAATSPLSPQKDQGCHEAQSTSPGMESAPLLEHAATFGRGALRRSVHETAVDRHDHEDRVRPICEQDDGSEQPTPVEGAKIGNEPEEPTYDGEARLHHVAPLIGRLPLDEKGMIIKLKTRRLLSSNVDVDRCPREHGRYRERKLSGQHSPPPD